MQLLWIVVLLLFQHAPACAQTAAENVDQIVYVNTAHPQASDQNPGSQALPQDDRRAAAHAIANNANQVGTKVTLEAGTYRESINLQRPVERRMRRLFLKRRRGHRLRIGRLDRLAEVGRRGHGSRHGLTPGALRRFPRWEPHVKLKDIVRAARCFRERRAARPGAVPFGIAGGTIFRR